MKFKNYKSDHFLTGVLDLTLKELLDLSLLFLDKEALDLE